MTDDRPIAAITSALLAVGYLALGIILLTVLLPRGQDVNAGAGLLQSLVSDGAGWWTATRWLMLAIAAVGVGVVASLRRLAPQARRSTADWAATLGLTGFIVLAIDQARLLNHTRGLAVAAAAEPDPAQRLVNLSFINLVDRAGIVTFGALALWLLVTSLMLLSTSVPATVRTLGATTALALLLLPILHETDIGGLVAGATAITVGPAFFGALAWHLWHQHRHPPRTPAGTDGRGHADTSRHATPAPPRP